MPVQSLQRRNLELLTAVRSLGADKENEKAAVDAAREEERKHVEEELSAIQAENARVQVRHRSPPTMLRIRCGPMQLSFHVCNSRS